MYPNSSRCSDTCISPELCLLCFTCSAVGGVQIHRGAGAVRARGRGAGEVRRALRGAAALRQAPAALQLRRVLAALLQQVLTSPHSGHGVEWDALGTEELFCSLGHFHSMTWMTMRSISPS